jgi:hypothetical protein
MKGNSINACLLDTVPSTDCNSCRLRSHSGRRGSLQSVKNKIGQRTHGGLNEDGAGSVKQDSSHDVRRSTHARRHIGKQTGRAEQQQRITHWCTRPQRATPCTVLSGRRGSNYAPTSAKSRTVTKIERQARTQTHARAMREIERQKKGAETPTLKTEPGWRGSKWMRQQK